MGLYKLREWVGTVTGKGDRWGRDRLGRSAPAFLSTTALSHLPARRKASQVIGSCCCLLQGRSSVAVCFEACAGRRIRWLCLPAVPCSEGCVPVHPLPAMPTALISSCPVQVCFAPFSHFCFVCPCSFPCAPGSVRASSLLLGPAVCQLQDCPVGSCNTGLQWRPVRRVHLTVSFSCRVHDPGPWE